MRGGQALDAEQSGGARYHIDAIEKWLEVEGNVLIADHIASIHGQGVLPLRLYRRHKP